MMRTLFVSLILVVGFLSVGCGSSTSDDGSVKEIKAAGPVTEEQKQAAQQAVNNDPKAADDAPRPDGK